jgi:nitrilase
MIRIAAAQTAPVFLDPARTTERILAWVGRAADQGVQVLAFGETFLPGYPIWVSHMGGAAFDEPRHKAAYRAYVEAAVAVDGPELAAVEAACRDRGVFVVLGVVERDPTSSSVFATAVPIHPETGILTPHRKLVPTYEERLVWAPGDERGLASHRLGTLRISALNCWENWMPRARARIYDSGTDLHVAIWPGSPALTRDITRFVALESRAYVLSAGAILRREDIPAGAPFAAELPDAALRSGGSCIAAPDGTWLAEPLADAEALVIADIDPGRVIEERLTFDPSGHYRPPRGL